MTTPRPAGIGTVLCKCAVLCGALSLAASKPDAFTRPPPFVTAVRDHIVSSEVAFKHLSSETLAFVAARGAAARSRAAPRHSPPALTFAQTQDVVGVVASLDSGLGFSYERAVGRRAVDSAAAYWIDRRQRARARRVRSGRVVPYGTATVAWFGSSDVAGSVAKAFLALSSVITVEKHVSISPQSCHAGQSAMGTAHNAADDSVDAAGMNTPFTCGDGSNAFARRGATGRRTTVAVADTGLETQHCRYAVSGVEMASAEIQEEGSEDMCGRLRWDSDEDPPGAPAYVRYTCTDREWCASFASDHAAPANDHGTWVASAVQDLTDAPIAVLDLQNSALHASDSIVPPPNIADHVLDVAHRCLGASILSFSWAADTKGAYTYLERAVDYYTWHNPDLLVVAAAGNNGASGAQSVGSPASAKNTVSVGALMASRAFFEAAHGNQDYATLETFWKQDMVYVEPPEYTDRHDAESRVYDDEVRGAMSWSSRGNTRDGRTKPDLAAAGAWVRGDYSGPINPHADRCDPDQMYTSMAGTSMATPVVAAAAAVLSDMFGGCSGQHGCHLRGNHETVPAPLSSGRPASSMLRAVLAHSTRPVRHVVDFVETGSLPLYGGWLRPIRLDDPAHAQKAQAATGFGELGAGPALLCDDCSTFVYGESSTREFIGSINAVVSAETGVLENEWSGDTSAHASCYRTTKPETAVTATLAWRDYPSHTGCTSCLQSDLALHVIHSSTSLGGASHDTVNNLEQIRTTVAGVGASVKVMVSAASVSHPLVDSQRYALVVSGSGLVLDPDGCTACSHGVERVPCSDGIGVGERACGSQGDDDSQQCDFYSSCYAHDVDTGSAMEGITSSMCAEIRFLDGGYHCEAVTFVTSDHSWCDYMECSPTRVLELPNGETHVCPPGTVHRCVTVGFSPNDLEESIASLECEPASYVGSDASAAYPPADGADETPSSTFATFSLFAVLGIVICVVAVVAAS